MLRASEPASAIKIRRWMIVVAVAGLMLGLIVNYPSIGLLLLGMAIVTAPQTILVAMLMRTHSK
jgi:hypothetical protein